MTFVRKPSTVGALLSMCQVSDTLLSTLLLLLNPQKKKKKHKVIIINIFIEKRKFVQDDIANKQSLNSIPSYPDPVFSLVNINCVATLYQTLLYSIQGRSSCP